MPYEKKNYQLYMDNFLMKENYLVTLLPTEEKVRHSISKKICSRDDDEYFAWIDDDTID